MLSDLSSSSSDFEDEEPPRKIRFIRDRENPFESLDDINFKSRFRLNKSTVMNLVHEIGDAIQPMTRRNKSIDARSQVLITLRFYGTGSFLELIGDYMQIHKSSICRIVQRVTHQIAQLSRRYIRMPKKKELPTIKQEFFSISGFPQIVGAVDCTHIRIQSPGGANADSFKNRKGFSSIKVQVICDASLKLLHIISRWPGSVDDSIIFNHSSLPDDFRNGRYGDGRLLGDSAYPCKPYLLTPLLEPTSASEEAYNKAHKVTRNTVETFIGVLKRRFPCLKNEIRLRLNTTLKVIVACGVLHNFCKQQNDIIEEYFNPIDNEVEVDNCIFNEDLNNNADDYTVRNALIATVFACKD